MWLLMLLALATSTTCLPIEEQEPSTTENVEQLQNTIHAVSYIQNFSNTLAEHIQKRYSKLTTAHRMDEIKQTLEEFLINFANDLKQAVDAQQNNVTFEAYEKIQDGVPDETYNDIRNQIMSDFPEIKAETADVIVFKLRKSLYETRQKIENIVKSWDKEFEYAIA